MENQFKLLHKELEPIRLPADFTVFDGQDRILDLLFTRTIKILIVVDGRINIGETDGFGVGRIIKLYREEKLGCYNFEVDIALRKFNREEDEDVIVENKEAGDFEARYVGFSFDSRIDGELVLDRYHELLLFGYAPNNDDEEDYVIDEHEWAARDGELEVLHQWMNEGGGVFATGDHDYLGASMCRRIPRVGTMREWTNEDGVPPQIGEHRLDTNQPANANQANGTEIILTTVERDEKPQHIDWVTNRSERIGFREFNYPHEILCHPDYGPINVMPDHPHEGRCVDNERIQERKEGKVRFGESGAFEYPKFGLIHPIPRIIAYGNVVARSNHEPRKGRVNAARFPMISVYDPRKYTFSNMGRVVVDSTWHHWFNMNIDGIEQRGATAHWEKIKRYFLNVATWIIPKTMRCNYTFLQPFFESEGIREIRRDTNTLDTGSIYRGGISQIIGPCATTSFVMEWLYEFEPELFRLYEHIEIDFDGPDINPINPLCLSCPPFEILEAYIFGEIFRILEPLVKKLMFAIENPKSKFSLSHTELSSMIEKGARIGIELFKKEALNSVKRVSKHLG
ncbi:MAG: hypothetical protein AAFQ94_13885 [Bacteroidota bacterium]